MTTTTLLQPFTSVIFFAIGCVCYFIYEFFRGFSTFKLAEIIFDFVASIVCCGLFLLVSHVFFYGQIKYYTLLCFFIGIFTLKLLFKDSIRKICEKISHKITANIKKSILFLHKKIKKLQAKVKGVKIKNDASTRKQTTTDSRTSKHRTTKNKTEKGAKRRNLNGRNSRRRTGTIRIVTGGL